MFRNTHATVGQSQGRVVVSAPKRVGSSPTPNLSDPPPSPVARPLPPRCGLSLTEVLISMGILTVGLLGVASVFPVASFYMQKGDIADRGSAIAQAAFNEVIANGTLNPENWLQWDHHLTSPTYHTFGGQFARTLRNRKATQTSIIEATANRQRNSEFGSVFIIDPIAAASSQRLDPTTRMPIGGSEAWARTFGRPSSVMPSSSFQSLPTAPAPPNWSPAWLPWGDVYGPPGPRWPIRRFTLSQLISVGGVTTKKAMEAAVAQDLFSTADDLALEVPSQDKPSQQLLEVATVDLNGDGIVGNDFLSRQSRGDYSWIVMVCPTTTEARDALATDPAAHSYEVSVVVFYKRPVGVTNPLSTPELESNYDLLRANERAARARVVSTGLNGGQLLLTATTDPITSTESPFANLKNGQWILVCGPHPSSSDMRPTIVARWYQVLSIEGKDSKLDASGNVTTDTSQPDRRLVSLRGPEWPWLPADYLTSNAELSNALYVCIPSGAVAVHAKTIRLEGESMWSGGASGFGKASPIGTAAPKHGLD